MAGISKSEVSQICAEPDEATERSPNRPITAACSRPDAKPVEVQQW